jgi:GTP cyclohydrolase II
MIVSPTLSVTGDLLPDGRDAVTSAPSATAVALFPNADALAEMQAERAVAELRAGRPIVIEDGEAAVVALGVEGLEPEFAMNVGDVTGNRARLVLPAARLRRLGVERAEPGAVALPRIDLARIERLALVIEARIDAEVLPVTALEGVALEAARIALTCPAVIVAPIDRRALPEALVPVPAGAIRSYRRDQVRRLKMVGRAPVPLEGAPETEFVVFRGGEGLRDQVAIVIGKPDPAQPVPVRLHSACLTGDLFGSLKCDCGDQLRDTVEWMAKNGGGVLLYLDQEGRGNGIANKMRAYRLQSLGWDTYDADEVLGFDLDQRRFDFAAEMLRQLGVTKVRLFTNNPEKIKAIEAAGIEVAGSERALGRLMPENERYLASKRDRAGHFIDLDALAERAV